MQFTSLLGNNFVDLVEQLPERMEMTEISPNLLILPQEGDDVVCKASKATQKLLLQSSALLEFGKRELERVVGTDLVSARQQYNQDTKQNVGPLVAILAAQGRLQMNLDVLASGGELTGHDHFAVDRDLNIVRLDCMSVFLRSAEVMLESVV